MQRKWKQLKIMSHLSGGNPLLSKGQFQLQFACSVRPECFEVSLWSPDYMQLEDQAILAPLVSQLKLLWQKFQTKFPCDPCCHFSLFFLLKHFKVFTLSCKKSAWPNIWQQRFMEKNSFGDSLPESDKIHRKIRLSLSGGAPVRLTFTELELELCNLNIGQRTDHI